MCYGQLLWMPLSLSSLICFLFTPPHTQLDSCLGELLGIKFVSHTIFERVHLCTSRGWWECWVFNCGLTSSSLYIAPASSSSRVSRGSVEIPNSTLLVRSPQGVNFT